MKVSHFCIKIIKNPLNFAIFFVLVATIITAIGTSDIVNNRIELSAKSLAYAQGTGCNNTLPEICDGIDNNCDEQIDEGFDVGQACSAGTGACEASGIKICTEDGSGTICNAVPGEPQPVENEYISNEFNHTKGTALWRFQVFDNKIYYAFLAQDETNAVQWQLWTATSNIDGTNFSMSQRTRTPQVNNTIALCGVNSVSCLPSMQVVGDKIYYTFVAQNTTHNNTNLWHAQMNIDGTGFTTTQLTTAPTIRGVRDVRFQVAGSKIYYSFIATNSTDNFTFWTASSDLDGTGFSATQRNEISGNVNRGKLQVVGDKVYYAFQGINTTNNTNSFWIASMNINGSGYSNILNISSDYFGIDFHVIGDKIYYIFIRNTTTEGFSNGQIWTGTSNTDGTNFLETQRTDVSGYGVSVNFPSMQVAGDKIYYLYDETGTPGPFFDNITTAESNIDGTGYTQRSRVWRNKLNALSPQMQVVGSSIFIVYSDDYGTKTYIDLSTESVGELCDNVDNDCDGQTDEDFNVGQECWSDGIGACQGSGIFVCNADGLGTMCNAVQGEPAEEVCDNLDNNCDGQTDELEPITCGTGSCQNTVPACFEGSNNVCEPLSPQIEICDNIDNDCDGQIDENCEINVTKNFLSNPSKDGYARSTKVSTSGSNIYIGKVSRSVQRGFLYFDTSEIPDNAVIKSVKLSVYGINLAKNNCPKVGNIDIIKCDFDPLSTSDFSGCTPGPSQNTDIYINLPESSKQWASISIGAEFINKQGATQFKLISQDERCSTGTSGNYANICADGGSRACTVDKRPRLEIIYLDKLTCNKLDNEVCGDGIDNNCDGIIDEGCSGFVGGTDITFVVFDEPHFETSGGPQSSVFRESNKLTGKHYPTEVGGAVEDIDFGILTGDLIDYWDGKTTNMQVSSMISNLNSATNKLDFPYYLMLGNHDMTDKIKTQVAEKPYANNKTFYSFDYNGVHFIVLDGSEWILRTASNQHTWLRDDLAQQDNNTPIVMFLHQLPTKNLGDGWQYCCIEDQKWLENLLGNTFENKKNIIGFFSGHVYKYLSGKWGWGTIWESNGTSLIDVPVYFDIDIFSCNGISKNKNLGMCVVHITDTEMSVAGYNVNTKSWTTQQVFKKTL